MDVVRKQYGEKQWNARLVIAGMDNTSLGKSVTAKYLSEVLKQRKTLPPDITRHLIEEQVAKHGSETALLYQDSCPRCFTPDQFSKTVSYSLLRCPRSKRCVRHLRSKNKLTAREQEMIASHEKFENIFLKRCLVCSHQKRTSCVLPDSRRLKKRRKIEDACRAPEMVEAEVQLPKIVVPEIVTVKTVKKPRLDKVDCGLNISPALKQQLQQYVDETSIESVTETAPSTKKKKKKKRMHSNTGTPKTSQNSNMASPAPRNGKCDVKNTLVLNSTTPSIVGSRKHTLSRNNSSTLGISKFGNHQPVNKGTNLKLAETPLKVQANSKNHNRMSFTATNALKNALSKSVPKQSSLKNFLDTIF
ncbi:hypothetical protein FHG87_000473 [Trinorchestia longiramus]|nr:hypothetical protein FHG87_000473 [Trinorchestia longiramus]